MKPITRTVSYLIQWIKHSKSLFKSAKLVEVLICVAITFSGVNVFRTAHAQASADDTYTLNLDKVNIHTLIETVSSRTNKNFIIDPRVKATVSVVSAKPVNADELYALFLSVLDVHGFAAVEAGSFIKIVPLTVGVKSAVPVFNEQVLSGDELPGDVLKTEVIRVENVPVQSLVESLRGLVPAGASISAEVTSNSIIITDQAANIERLTDIIRSIDASR